MSIVHIEGQGSEPLAPEDQGSLVALVAIIGYPGSKISDVLIGGYMVQVPNGALREAIAAHDRLCDTEGG